MLTAAAAATGSSSALLHLTLRRSAPAASLVTLPFSSSPFRVLSILRPPRAPLPRRAASSVIIAVGEVEELDAEAEAEDTELETPSHAAAAAADEAAEEPVADEESSFAAAAGGDGGQGLLSRMAQRELYVCNLPRNFGIAQLLKLFKPHGTVIAVEVPRDRATGMSRGTGFITMYSISEAKAAIAALNGSDLNGRELRVQFCIDVYPGRHGDLSDSSKLRTAVYDTPYKVYVGNIPKTVHAGDVRRFFDQCGLAIAAQLVYRRKGAETRVFGFVSFLSAEEKKAALKFNGTHFHGRPLLVREAIHREKLNS